MHVDEFLDAVAGQFPSVAGVLDPAERKAGVRGGQAIDGGVAGLQPLGDGRAPLEVGGPDVAPKPEWRAFATRTASSTSLARTSGTAGPKTSSASTGMSAVTWSSTVGS